MYTEHFGLDQEPFSIAPDPRFLFLSEGHNEALAHLMYGFSHGGFVLITGEVGTGKTTLLRNLLDRTPPEIDVAFILNPRLTVQELLETLCDELGVPYPNINPGSQLSVKHYLDALNKHLLRTHQADRSTVVIIDEAQNLSPAVLEQIRLLTNLETNEKKLLRIILVGQPELAQLLARNELRQLAQRITARYHLAPLQKEDVRHYVNHRLQKAGGNPTLFSEGAIKKLFRLSKGTPRLINVIADRALLGAYVAGTHQVNADMVASAAKEILHSPVPNNNDYYLRAGLIILALVVVMLGAYFWAPTTTSVADNATNPDLASNINNNNSNTKASLTANTEMAVTGVSNVPNQQTQSQHSNSNAETTGKDDGTLFAPVQINRPAGRSSTVQKMAYQAIFNAWGGEYPLDNEKIPCDYAPQLGLQCLGRRGGWSEIDQVNLPVVLDLWDDQATPFHAAVTGKANDRYNLVIAGVSHSVSPRDLRDLWFGAYVTLWQTPPNYRGSLREGDTHVTVAWLHRRLAELNNGVASNFDNYFDSDLKKLVLDFQQQEGLLADGIVGPMTWVRLGNRLNLPAPKLVN